jgi:hypothetical protein
VQPVVEFGGEPSRRSPAEAGAEVTDGLTDAFCSTVPMAACLGLRAEPSAVLKASAAILESPSRDAATAR